MKVLIYYVQFTHIIALCIFRDTTQEKNMGGFMSVMTRIMTNSIKQQDGTFYFTYSVPMVHGFLQNSTVQDERNRTLSHKSNKEVAMNRVPETTEASVE